MLHKSSATCMTLLVATLLFSSSSFSAKTESNKTESKVDISRVEQSKKRQAEWGLTDKEWSRYQNLMKGIRGSVSPKTISPIEVLGIHAKTPAERMKYARLWADMMEKDTQRILEFQKAYNQAWSEKAQQDLVDISKLQLGVNSVAQGKNTDTLSSLLSGRYILITKLKGCAECDRELAELLKPGRVSKLTSLSIYFADSKGANKGIIRQWAQSRNIDTELLRSKKVTLHHGGNVLSTYNLRLHDLPALFMINKKGGAKRVK